MPQHFSLVCFRFNPEKEYEPADTEMLNKKLLDSVNSTGRVYMTHTIAGGIYMLRFAVGATLTEDRHVISAWELIKESAHTLLK
ncbi:hypothetical protein FXO37_11017 [Capsicum annuum]|nr:hypothetical protein FXO37_11017 [Capsicum annuum]